MLCSMAEKEGDNGWGLTLWKSVADRNSKWLRTHNICKPIGSSDVAWQQVRIDRIDIEYDMFLSMPGFCLHIRGCFRAFDCVINASKIVRPGSECYQYLTYSETAPVIFVENIRSESSFTEGHPA